METCRSASTAAKASPGSRRPNRRRRRPDPATFNRRQHMIKQLAKAAWRFLWSAAATIAVFSQAMADPLHEQTEIRYQGWAGQVTFVELADDLGYLAPLKLKWVGNTISGPQDIQTVVTGDVDIGGAFYGAIIKLIVAKAPIKAVVGYYGSDA